MSSALKIYHSQPGFNDRPKQTAVIGSADRTSNSWPESFTKMRTLIAAELKDKDADDDFWGNELVAVHDAQREYDQTVADLDHKIAHLKSLRRTRIEDIASRLPDGSNLPAFLRADNPSGYLCW